MKIRNGFVTNSSSSSFIIAFKDRDAAEESVRKAIEKNPPLDFSWSGLSEEEMIEKTITYMMNGIEDVITSLEEIKTALKDELESRARWKFFYSTRNFDFNYLETDEYKQKEQKFIEEQMAEIMPKLESMGLITYPSFSDNDGCIGSYIEHTIAPSLEETLCSFSHH